MSKNLIFLILIFNVTSYSQNNVTLNDLIEIAFNHNNDIKIAESKIKGSTAKVDEINSQFLPQLKINAGYSRLSDAPPFEVTLPTNNKPVQIGDEISNNYNLRLSINQPLFTGFRLTSMRNSSRYIYKATDEELIKIKNETAQNVIIAYWNLYKALQSEKIIEENIKAVEKHIADTRNFMSNGLATMNDLLKLEVQLSNLKLSLIEIRNNAKLAELNLNNITGQPIENKINIFFPEPVYKYEQEHKSALINEALENRSEIKSQELRIMSSNENVISARSGYYPAIFLFGNLYYNNPNLRYQPPQNKFYGSWDLGVNFSWDIWNWGLTKAQKIQAEELLFQSKINLEQIKDNIEIEVNQAYLNYIHSFEKLPVIQKLIEQTEENLRITQNKFSENIATSTDIIEAENSLYAAKLSLNNAIADTEIAKAKLYKAAGRKLY